MPALDYSLTLIAPVADLDAANGYFAALGWGDAIFVAELSPDGQLPVTHKACHLYQTAEFVATLQAAKASDDEQLAALNQVFIFAAEGDTPAFDAAIAAHDPVLQRYYPPIEW